MMGYGKEIYQSAIAVLETRKRRAEDEAQEHKQAFYQLYPRAEEIDRELSKTAIAAAKAVLNGSNAVQQLHLLKDHNLALQKERHALLLQAGLSDNALEPHYLCEKCGDTGYIDGRMCSCMKDLLRKEAYRKLNEQTPVSLCRFEDFSLDYYSDIPEHPGEPSPRKEMEQIFNDCQRYAQQFSLDSPNLLLQGGTGLGKTHLSLAIASAAIDRGYGIIYGSAQNLATNLERERFQHERAEDSSRIMLDCDLLILDDLGTEFITSFVTAAIYNIINTRLMAQKPTIINTNLSMQELESRYTERFVSRIIGSYEVWTFRGRDIRLKKRLSH